MDFPIWMDRKLVALSHHERIRLGRRIHLPAFAPPAPCPSLSFGPLALSAAFGRTAGLHAAPWLLRAAEQVSLLAQLAVTVANGSPFQLSDAFGYLNDDGATTLAGRCGAAVTGLYMNALGYGWRDNAQCIAPASDPRADFIYYGGPSTSLGVVLAEAHGTFARRASASEVRSRARSKYTRQVSRYVGAHSPYGPVLHGYSVAFGSCPGVPGAYLAVAETGRPTAGPPSSPPPSPSPVPVQMTLATHRANFDLMGAHGVVAVIDALLDRRPRPTEPQRQNFVRLRYGGDTFLMAPAPAYWLDAAGMSLGDPLAQPRSAPGPWIGLPIRYAIEERCGRAFLDWLSGRSRATAMKAPEDGTPSMVELPAVEPRGFGPGVVEDGGDELAMFRDGLAAFAVTRAARAEPLGIVEWSSGSGFTGR